MSRTGVLSFILLSGYLLGLAACGQTVDVPSGIAVGEGQPVSAQGSTDTPEELIAPTPRATETQQPSSTTTATLTETLAPTLTPTETPTITVSPTSEYPLVRVMMQANCRYGPGTAYLYSHGLYEGDQAEVHGRNYPSTWLWIQPENLDRHCWVAASVVELVSGDIQAVVVANNTRLPFTTFIGPPDQVRAERNGNEVVVRWSEVNVKPPEDSRGYLIEATLCQSGILTWVAVHTEGTSYTFIDEQGCSGPSGGKLYAVEKHGYTDPVVIPWP